MAKPDEVPRSLHKGQLAQFDELLSYLKQYRGFDFSSYKRTSLMRRVLKRMGIVGIARFDRYTDYLQVHPEECALLFNHLLINVTSFFRDQTTWEFLNDQILPKLLGGKPEHHPIRLWSAGCASGQEPYSLAMLLCERLGMEAFQQRVKIYASDIDEEALAAARHATYGPKDVQGVPPPLMEKYFESAGQGRQVRSDLRRMVIFGRHDLLADAPISRLDLLVCRNTLMYFNAEAQHHILARFHFALNDTGYLFLGKAEMLLTHGDLFTPVDLRHRIFTKVPKTTVRDLLSILHQMGDEEGVSRFTRQLRTREIALESGSIPQIVIDIDGNFIAANDRAKVLFGLTAHDLGRPFRDLQVSYRPIELRSPIEQAYRDRHSVRLTGVERHLDGGILQTFDVDVVPLFENGGDPVGVSIAFHDVSRLVKLQAELQRSKHDLETAYEELQSTNEELETTNEELQSTVEEWETTNEELQSTNEELQTVNAELQDRTAELTRSNVFLESILASLHAGVAVLDERLNVLMWNHEAEDLWGLRAEEVQGKSFMSLDIGLPVEHLKAAIRQAIAQGHHEVTMIPCLNRRGKTTTVRVSCLPLRDTAGGIHGAIVLMEDWEKI